MPAGETLTHVPAEPDTVDAGAEHKSQAVPEPVSESVMQVPQPPEPVPDAPAAESVPEREQAPEPEPGPKPELTEEPIRAPELESEAAAEPVRRQAPESAPEPKPEPAQQVGRPSEPRATPEPEPREPVDDVKPKSEPEPRPETSQPAETSEDEPRPEDDEQPSRPARSGKPNRASGLLPGSLRRERRAWAGEKGFDFIRSDEYLNDEWARGAAASGSAARDIVRGHAFGHEMVLMDLGGVNVMAVRRGAASEVVVDFRRASFEDQQPSEDLLAVRAIGDFQVFATETGPAERIIDKRVTTALTAMPEVVTAVWMESDWVLAQTGRGSHSGDWEEMLAPLALLADAARVLPPRPSVAQTLSLEEMDPTRQMEPPADLVIVERGGSQEHELLTHPLVVRPEEPLEMPTRVRAETRGVVEPRAIGGDEVEAIADGEEPEWPERFNGTRMRRDLSRGPSIFDDEPER